MEQLERMVAAHHGAEEIVPHRLQFRIIGRPLVQIEILPKPSIVPVAATDGNDGLVGGKGVVVVDAAVSALQPFSILCAPHIVIKRGHAGNVEVGGIVQGSFFGQLTF